MNKVRNIIMNLLQFINLIIHAFLFCITVALSIIGLIGIILWFRARKFLRGSKRLHKE